MLIYHEIQTKYFEVMVLVTGSYLRVHTLSSIGAHLFHFGEDTLLKIIFLGGVG